MTAEQELTVLRAMLSKAVKALEYYKALSVDPETRAGRVLDELAAMRQPIEIECRCGSRWTDGECVCVPRATTP